MQVPSELETALTQVIQLVVDAKDFAISEAPDVIQQLLTYTAVVSVVWIVVVLIPVFFIYMLAFKWMPQELDMHGGVNEDKIGAMIVLGLVGFLASIIIVFRVLTLIKVLIAPKVFLLQYAADLVK